MVKKLLANNTFKENHQKMSNLEKAIELACSAHAGQVDKAGKAYILHPLRLMLKFQDEIEQTIAVLHDVVEDSDVTLDDIEKSGFQSSIISALDCLTKRKNEEYMEFIVRVSCNELARKIKIEDLKDNMDLTRISSLDEKDLDRVDKYHKALKYFLELKN